MYKLILNKNEIKETDYNFVISSVILSQIEQFTYNDIIEKLRDIFGYITNKIETTAKSCLIRLRDDGFLNILGSNYQVVELPI